MDTLALNFSFALLSATTFVALIALIFNGTANTTSKYIFSIVGSCGALLVFGEVMSNIVTIVML